LRYIGILFFKLIPTLLFIIGNTPTFAQESVRDNQCLECHSDSGQLKGLSSQFDRLLISSEFNDQSVHNEINCTGCHADPGGYPHPEVIGLIQCGTCHEVESNEYLSGPHGNQLNVSMDLAPKCWDCHKLHLVRESSNELSNVHIKNEAKTCTSCHGEEQFKRRISNLTNSVDYDLPKRSIIKGIHYLNQKFADTQNPLTCSKCHGVHSLSEVIGKIWLSNYSVEANFCGECHDNESISFKGNLHFNLGMTSTGEEISLTCSDCHLEHLVSSDIYQDNEEKSAGQVTDKCVECHLPVRISRSFSQNAIGFNPSIDSFHGTSSLGGKLFFSNCSSCHGIHELQTYNGKNKEEIKLAVIAECGACHPNAATNFVSSPVHMAQGEEFDSEESIAKYVFLTIIITMILLIASFIIIDLYKLYLRRNS